MCEKHALSRRQAAFVLCIAPSTINYIDHPREPEIQEQIAEQLRQLVEKHPTAGFKQCFHRLKRQGFTWNHKRVYRIYKLLGLNRRKRKKKRLPARVKRPLVAQYQPNAMWSMDFVHDQLADGRSFRVLNIMDDFNREIIAQEADTSLSAPRVIRVLERVCADFGTPKAIRSDNGPEFVSHAMKRWCKRQGIDHQFIRPGKPTENAYVERSHRTLREELLNLFTFNSLDDVREHLWQWSEDYNLHRPHSALGYQTPMDLRRNYERQFSLKASSLYSNPTANSLLLSTFN